MTSTLDRPVKEPAFHPLSGRRKATNALATVLVSAAVLIALIPLVWVLYTVFDRGFTAILSADWWFKSQNMMTNRIAGGGAYHAIVGTLFQGLFCAIISVPIGIFVAIYLVEYGANSRLAKVTTFMVDILTGVPSIVAALFIYALWVATLGLPRSGLAVSLALVLLMIPVVVRSSEEMLKIVPNDLREASFALGVPKWKTIARIVLPTALSGVVTGVMLALARVMGETAPLLVLVGYSKLINYDMFGGEMASLPGMMLDQRSGSVVGLAESRLWGAALTLILLVAILNVIAKLISRFFAPKKV
ncbi:MULTISPECIES: phosphate ABC transporter permease PstA [Mycobacteroides]|jgi:phosphate transport system permease protein|uniref:Phosphate transport system permease protein PstA n=1 Tax=Mycobacteroides chelonae TaxID=1774 RepID=A0AB73MU19_MYCCH|nr:MULTISPECIES: phosphate ABC transporter permease PstA [Mycobacteroides]AMW18463.1 phosphate ABC transporter, permease protein PstA [Mycobacterium sp. QIA-37]PKQ57938.1 phosphate ABC transporter, permease protein PstA [Mycobacterium sp. MHSD3]SKO05401.1 Putative phosphate ABC transporter, permease protein [Mycobacteroides abscessus subsp. bolletii]AYM40831.1 phosphate ABC transporter permease PstA [[Mycobacterium] chelonae subsp. gwanakae]KRQ30571.1 phosphate ABC transporter permease [Mycoba